MMTPKSVQLLRRYSREWLLADLVSGVTVGLVALEPGLRLVAPLTGIDRDQLREGMALEIVFPEVAGENRLPSFRPLP